MNLLHPTKPKFNPISAPLKRAFSVLSFISLTSLAGAQTKPEKDASQKLQDNDLKVLLSTLPVYKVTDADLQVAATEVWKLATGSPPQVITIQVPAEIGKVSLTLELAKVPVFEVFNYIAELSGCEWKIRGTDPSSLVMEFIAKPVFRDTRPLFSGQVFMMTDEIINSFRTQAGELSADMKPMFKSYNINFDLGAPSNTGYAHYNAVDQTLVVVLPQSDMFAIEALLKRAHQGKLRPPLPR